MRSAHALKKTVTELYPQSEVVILDTFRYANPLLEKIVIGTYMEMLKISPVIHGYLYHRAERDQPFASRGKTEFNRILNLIAAPKLENFIKYFQPEIIVCTHPFPLGIISNLKKKGVFRGIAFAVITDYTVHYFWVFPGIDCFLIGSEILISECKELGIEPKKVCPTGIPIDPEFNKRYDQRRLKEQMGFNPMLPVILIIGGGLGMGPLELVVKVLGEGSHNRQLLVVTGTNKALQEKLSEITHGFSCQVKVFGYVNNMHQLMALSDLMIGKAGGLTCAEAMASGLPLFIVDPLPGQEEKNAKFMVSMGTGVRIREKDLADTVKNYLKNQKMLKKIAETAIARGKPNAAYDAVKIMAEAVSKGNHG
jgi:processive 1,2-diacylglycerol beta-glucosyltransferase